MTAAALVWESCGAELRAGDKFCHECAAPVVATAKSAEYKQVTTLFAEVVIPLGVHRWTVLSGRSTGFTYAYTEERHGHRPIQSAMPARQDRGGVGGDDGHHRPE
jgi:hypothetical protein